MITYEDKFELMGEITQGQNSRIEARGGELFELYNSTNDPDLRQIIASDLFKEFGITVEP